MGYIDVKTPMKLKDLGSLCGLLTIYECEVELINIIDCYSVAD